MKNNAYYRAALAKKHIGTRMEVNRAGKRGAFYCQVSSTTNGIIRNESPVEHYAITATINELDQLKMVNWHNLEIGP